MYGRAIGAMALLSVPLGLLCAAAGAPLPLACLVGLLAGMLVGLLNG